MRPNLLHAFVFRESLHGRSEQVFRSEEHTSELQSRPQLVCRLLLEKKKIPLSPSRHPASRRTPCRSRLSPRQPACASSPQEASRPPSFASASWTCLLRLSGEDGPRD